MQWNENYDKNKNLPLNLQMTSGPKRIRTTESAEVTITLLGSPGEN